MLEIASLHFPLYLTWKVANTSAHSIEIKGVFFHLIVRSIPHIQLCLLFVWLNFTWCRLNYIFINEELSIIDFNHKQEDNTSQDKNSIQTPENYAILKCEQQIWDEEGWSLKACCPLSCQSPMQLLAWMTLTVSCKKQKWATNQGWKRALLKYCYTSMHKQLYPNFRKWSQHKSEQPIWDEKGPSKSWVNAQYSYWQQMTLTLCHQAEMWGPNLAWKKNLARYICPTIDLKLMWNQLTFIE